MFVSLACAVAACEAGPANPALGTISGAAAGGALGSTIGGGSRARTAATVGGALLGGMAGNQLIDRPVEERQRQEMEASRDREMQRRLDFERLRALQEDEVQRQIEERRLFEEWQRERAAGRAP